MQFKEVKLMLGNSGEPKSLMSALTAEEAKQFSKWCNDQPRSAIGAIDAMNWPGWDAVKARRGLEPMKAAFEARYQRDWEDPAGDEMKAIWADAWAAAKAVPPVELSGA